MSEENIDWQNMALVAQGLLGFVLLQTGPVKIPRSEILKGFPPGAAVKDKTDDEYMEVWVAIEDSTE